MAQGKRSTGVRSALQSTLFPTSSTSMIFSLLIREQNATFHNLPHIPVRWILPSFLHHHGPNRFEISTRDCLWVHFICFLDRRTSLPATFQQITPLEVGVWMYNSVQLCSGPTAIFLNLLDFTLVRPFEHAVAGYVISLLFHVFLDPTQDIPIVDSRRLQQSREIVEAEVTIGASVTFTRTRWMFRQNLLARVRRVASAAPDGISPHITIYMAHIVSILLVESIIGDQLEGLSPEDKTILQRKPNTLEKEGVLQSTKMLQVTVLAESQMQVPHAQREVLGQSIDGGRVYLSSGKSTVGIG